jgi:hypothetical protein
MRRIILIAVLVGGLTGCSATKEAIGEYVTEAVSDKIVTDIDGLLEKRGLSAEVIKDSVDENSDGKISEQEVLSTVKDLAQDYAVIGAKNYVDSKLDALRAETASKDDVRSTSDKFWQWILGLISMYLGKQLYSQRGDAKRDQRLALLEKVIQKDLDGDGTIGSVTPTVSEPNNEDSGQVV